MLGSILAVLAVMAIIALVGAVPFNVLDVFKADAFSTLTLTDAVNREPIVPGRVRQMVAFQEEGILTDTIELEYLDGVLGLVPNTPPGAPPNRNDRSKRKVRTLKVTNLPQEDTIWAAECGNIREFGGVGLQTAQTLVNQRMRRMVNNLEATVEWQAMGAIRGIILDADGSTIYNLFDELDVTQEVIDMNLDNNATEITTKCRQIIRHVEAKLLGRPYREIRVLCGQTFFDDFITHPLVKDAYKYAQATMNVNSNIRGFRFGDIWWEEYIGNVSGGSNFVAATEAHVVPIGVNGLFRTVYAPAPFMETINTVGLPRYMKMERKKYDEGMDILLTSRPLHYCTMPEVLAKLTRT